MTADVKRIAEDLQQSVRSLDRAVGACAPALARACELVTAAFRDGRGVLLFGNGGSAADAQHFAAEFVGRFELERAPMYAVALTTDTSALTAIGNDYGYDAVFERQLRGLGRPGDVAIGFTTSGNSANVCRALEAASEIGMRTIAFTGPGGGKCLELADVTLAVPAPSTALVQEAHGVLGHVLCRVVELDASGLPVPGASVPSPVAGLEELVAARAGWRDAGLTVVWTNGAFDLLHAGHLDSLTRARALGDVLVVGVNSDASVRASKGPDRPVVGEADRAALVAGLGVVDHAVIFSEETPVEALRALQPDVHCKGAEYAPPDGRPVPERELVESYGGRVEFLPLVEGRSTTSVVEALRSA